MNIDKFLSDEQDVKAVEKVIFKLNDLLTSGEEIHYLAVQKKPAVNLLPDSIAVSNKRIFYCEPGNLGLTMNFKDISWRNIKEVSFKEEFFGAKFICVPVHGENIVTEFIPRQQARKLYQAATEQLEHFRKEAAGENRQALYQTLTADIEEAQLVEEETPVIVETPVMVETETAEDEITQKLRKLKKLYDSQLITLEEYENKKADILNSL